MSLSITSIAPSDGRLGSKHSSSDTFNGPAADSDSSEAQDSRTGFFLSTLRATRIRRNNQLLGNANDAISLIQVAEEALEATAAALHKMQTLSNQTTGGTDASHDNLALLAKKAGLTEELQKIFDGARFNNQPLLNGSITEQMYPVGDTPDHVIPVTIGDVSSILLSLGERMGEVVAQGTDTNDQTIREAQSEIIDHAIRSVSNIRTTLGSLQDRFKDALAHLRDASENTAEITPNILDADFAKETSAFTRNVILEETELSILTQANQQPRVAIALLE